MTKAILALENGRVFQGTSIGVSGTCLGEAVFNTSMTGYQEVLSDPSYAGQVVVMTAPQIGNTGTNDEDNEASKAHCAGFVVREVSPVISSWRSSASLNDYLVQNKIVGIAGVDTRAVTRALREGGAQRSGISSELAADELIAKIKSSPKMEGQDLASAVSCASSYQWTDTVWAAPWGDAQKAGTGEYHVVAVDFGIKRNILRRLASVGARITVVPANTSAAEIMALSPDGVFLSNGPGDPAVVSKGIETAAELIKLDVPLFGICLGHQILALALGAKTYKLPFGHHGANHPVRDDKTGKVEITSQNHGFAVDTKTLSDEVAPTHLNLYDDTLAGLACEGKPVFGIQYHPEASPGPHDASYLFERFADAMKSRRAS